MFHQDDRRATISRFVEAKEPNSQRISFWIFGHFYSRGMCTTISSNLFWFKYYYFYLQLVCDCSIAVQVLSKNGFVDLVSALKCKIKRITIKLFSGRSRLGNWNESNGKSNYVWSDHIAQYIFFSKGLLLLWRQVVRKPC